MATEIRVPTLGESVTEATIGRWMKQAGEAVSVDEPLVELETDKVSVEVPAPAAGVLASIAAQEGDTVEVNACTRCDRHVSKCGSCAAAQRRNHQRQPASEAYRRRRRN